MMIGQYLSVASGLGTVAADCRDRPGYLHGCVHIRHFLSAAAVAVVADW